MENSEAIELLQSLMILLLTNIFFFAKLVVALFILQFGKYKSEYIYAIVVLLTLPILWWLTFTFKIKIHISSTVLQVFLLIMAIFDCNLIKRIKFDNSSAQLRF